MSTGMRLPTGRLPFAANDPLGTEDFSDRFQIPHKLYGRERESAMLLAAFEDVSANGD